MNIGFLSPRSDAHPGIALDLASGLKLYLKQKQKDDAVRMFTESIGFGGSEKEVYEKAEKLLMVDDVDILLAFIDLRVIDILKPLLYASGKLMIVINAGANYPINWVPQENIIYLTLQHAFCNWLNGRAASLASGDGAVATGFYDCGYLHIAAGVKAFTQNGGNIVFNFVNNDKKYDEGFNITALTEFLDENRNCKSLLCTYDSLPASLFYDALSKNSSHIDLHLFVSPMMLEPAAIKQLPAGYPFSITGHSPWQALDAGEHNRIFTEACAANKKNANCFSLLGWEAGMIIENILDSGVDDINNGAALVERLKNAELNSPRGPMLLDAGTNFFLTPVVKCSIAPNEKNITVTDAKEYEAEWKSFVSEPVTGVVSGWTNTYLCY